MADPLSVAASIVGVTIPALHGVRLLLDDLQKISNAPEVVGHLKEDVRSVEVALTSLKEVKDDEWESLGKTVAEESKMTIDASTRACDKFRKDLQRWTRHSEDGKLAWQDRATVGFFKQGRIKTMSEQLQNCKLSINAVVSIGTFYNSLRNTHMTEEIKKTMATKQAEIASAVKTTDQQVVEANKTLDELNTASDNLVQTESTEKKADALSNVEEELRALSVSQKLLAELLLKVQEDAVTKAAAGKPSGTTTVTFGAQNSGFQAGVINGPISGLSFGGK